MQSFYYYLYGAPNRIFLTYLFSQKELTLQFLKDVGLIRGNVQCNFCKREMTWTADPKRNDRFRWLC